MQGLIDIEPKQYLDFVAEEGKLGQTTLNVFNLTSNQLSFKIKTANPMQFQVKPSIGLIQPNNQVSIVITTAQPLKADGNLISKFQINACTLLQEEQDLANFWRSLDASLIQQVQVRSRIKPAEVQQENIPQQLQQSVASENNDVMNLLYQSIVDPQSRQKDEEIQRYQEQIDQMTKELSDYQLILKSVKQQQAAVKHLGNKFDLKQVLITGVISMVLGFIFGN
ncbi:unnamed protein product (macronuclear) [Paramecium tetraurelia]|uniref:MSP domain-containing protein n=1 Tax=Paramecium tetraurelia TaxID=5888 RepID=A0DXB6_PARTE|nr:uncharacterized protein GSPATT00021316001 [Paramecium tetraurelia]CAK87683.1 unnamed protein product [Paramecium tetraurelia]|eukprot:XP_001455080.1 hypothetical protein (macronuclear) [Paramecium tetraurelia strain d4-2]